MKDKIKIYTCGPMQGCSTAESKEWRDWVAEQTKDWAECLDPTRRDYRSSSDDKYDDNDGHMPWWIVKEIVELDKIDIQESNVSSCKYAAR